jgi:hypothetical protein
MTKYNKLSDRIALKNLDMVKSLLAGDKNLDLTYKEGKFFKISIKNNSNEILEVLLDYFKKNQLNKYEVDSEEYQNLKSSFKNILDDAIEEVDLSKKMKEVLAPYIDFENSIDERLNDSFLEDITIPFENETFNSSEEERGLVGNNEPITNHNSEVISH